MSRSKVVRARIRASVKRKLASNLAVVFLLTLISVPFNAPEVKAATVGSGNCVQQVSNSTGVEVTSSGSDCIIKFTATGSNTWTVPNSVTSVRALIIGGGGGGGAWVGGGGGGGGFRDISAVSVTAGNAIAVTVGSGGNPANVVDRTYTQFGTNGGESKFGSVTAAGGGRGGSHPQVVTNGAIADVKPLAGGSGGGGTGAGGNSGADWTTVITAGTGNTPSTSPSQGFSGGAGLSSSPWVAGGGGGAGGVGSNATSSSGGAGGPGASSDITGSAVLYAGGGGGIVYNSTTGGGAGGSGGGGAGTPNGTGVSGTANTGGGGGGGGSNTSQTSTGGSGGSGVVIIRYTTATQSAGTGNCSQTYTSTGSGTVSVAEANGFCYIAFRNTGSVNSQTTFGLTKPANVNTIDYLVVAGGGGGAVRHGGGGGAGGLHKGTLSVSSLTAISAVVGAGGAGGVPPSGLNYGPGTSGQDSSLQSVVAKGGGAGNTGGSSGDTGLTGGSGGGALAVNAGGLGTSGQGTNGAGGIGGVSPYSAGGGGGAGGAGTAGSGSNGGAGGAGAIWDSSFTTTIAQSLGWASSSPQFSGNQVFFAGGGGGGVAGGTGGLGSAGGGAGSGNSNGTSATAASGSGGGGSGCCFTNPSGGDGGSGVVIIRYALPYTVTYESNGGSTVSNATFSVGGAGLTLPSPTKSGFYLQGWYSDSGLTNFVGRGGETYSPSSSLTLYAGWTNLLINLDANASGSLANSSSPWNSVLPGSSSASGAKNGNVLKDTTGSISYATFDGTGDAYVFDAGVGQVSGQMTVEAWINPANLTAVNSFQIIATRWFSTSTTGTTSDRDWHFALYDNGTGPKLRLDLTGNTGTTAAIYGTRTFPSSSLNKWYLVGFSINSNNEVQLFINGQPDGALRPISRTASSTARLLIGDARTAAAGIQGSISKFRIYNKGLTDSEIKSNFNSEGALFGHQTITFNANDGSANPSTSTQVVETSASTPLTLNTFTRTGYTFAGWNTAANGSGTNYSNGQNVSLSSGVTLYAKWTADTYTVTYSYNNATGGNSTTTSSFTIGGTAITLPTPNRTGYTFAGWFEDSGFAGSALGSTYSPTQSRTIYAKWTINSYTVTYNSNGGSSVTAGSFTFGGSISSAPTAPTRTGYTFTGWSATDGGSAITFPYSPGVATNITLYAKWTFSATPVLSYNASDINSYESTSTSVNDLSGNNRNATASAGISFDSTNYSWNFPGGTNSTGPYIDVADINSGVFSAGITVDFEADFGPTKDFYERIIDFGNGELNNNILVTREGTSSNIYIEVHRGSVAGGRCIYSNGISENVMTRYTITLDGTNCKFYKNGATTPSYSTPYTYLPLSGASSVNLTASYVGKSNWIADAQYEGKIRSLRIYSGAFTPSDLAAFSYKTVTYNANSGSSTPSSATTSGALRLPTAITRTGYTFQGWYDGSNYLTATKVGDAGSSYSPSASATVYAGWAAATYTVTYAYNSATGGNSTATSSFTTGGTAITLPTPTRTGYTFAGWFEDSGFAGSALGSTYSPTQSRTIYAKWNADTYTVTYSYNSATGGNSTATSSFTTGGSAITLPTPTRTGYTFAGWFEDSGFAGSALGSTYSPTQSRTIYAKWTEVNYTITYNVNGATGTPERSTDVYGISSGAITLPTVGSMTRTGYQFDGWSETNGGSKLTSPYTPTQTRTLYARWNAISYTINYFDTSATSGSAPSATSFTTGGSAVIISGAGTLARSGYTFAGWNTKIDGTGTDYAENATLTTTAPVNLYPKWTAVNYTVTYCEDSACNNPSALSGDVPVDVINYNIGDAVTVKGNSGNLARTGYTFEGWTDNSGGTGTTYRSGETYTVQNSNIRFYPKWTANTYNITYNTNGASSGSPSRTSDTYETGTSGISLPNIGTMVRTGYTFTGWSTSPTGSAHSGTFTTTSDVALYAIWTIKQINYSYSLGSAGQLLVDTGRMVKWPTPLTGNSQQFNSTLTLSANIDDVYSDGTNSYQFFGWRDDILSNIFKPNSNYLINSESQPTFTAQWVQLFAVRYALNGGTGSVGNTSIESECLQANSTCTDGQTITLNTAPTRAGYSFSGWIDQSGTVRNATTDSTSSTLVVRSTNYLQYAQWTPVDYSISFNSVGGSQNPAAETKNIGQTVTLPDPGTRSGYDFSGWTVGGVTYGIGTSYTVGASDAVFTALWTAKRYNVSYDWNGGVGTPTASSTFTHGNAAITLPTGTGHTKDGYVFDGWAVRVNGTLENSGAAVGLTHTPTSDVQYVARWADGAYTITYNAVGGTGISASASVNRTTSTTLPTPTRTNYSFEGWYEDAATTVLYGQAGASKTPTESRTIYAKWVQDSLYGINPAHLNSLTSITVTGSHTWSGTHSASGTGAALDIPNGALPNNTVVQVSFVEDLTRPKDLINQNYAYYTSVVLHWQLGSGSSATVPTAASGKPLVLTLTNPDIRAGAKIYKIIKGVATQVATATQDGQVSIEVSQDPEIVVAAAAPTAPLSVSAVGNLNAQSTVSWTAPASSGGAEVTSYTVTSSPGNQTCTATGTTSCTVSGLTNNTTYTFTVVANNAVGSSVASAASAGIIPRLLPTFNATFDSKGGSSVSDTLFNNTDGIAEPSTPTRSGYTFAGWLSTDGDASTLVTFPYSPNVNSDVTLYAYWVANSQNSSGGSGSSSGQSGSSSSGSTSTGSSTTQNGSASAQTNASGNKPANNLPQGPIEYIAPQSQFPELKDAPYPTNGFNVPTVGQFIGLIEGKPVEVVVKPQETQTVIEFGSDVAITLISQDSTGDPIEVGPNGSLTVIQGAFIQAQGNGFKSNSPVEAWLHSEPIRLGSGFANDAGEFENKFAISTDVPTGEHTLVLNGLTGEGQIVTLALGVEVTPIADQAPVPVLPGDIFDLPGILRTASGLLFALLLIGFAYLAYRRRRNS